MNFEDIIYEKKDGIAKISINRPEKLNAMRTQSFEEVLSAIRDATDDSGVGVIVITGVGDRSFSAGGDIGKIKERTPQTGRNHFRRLIEMALAIRSCGKPVIAAVNGYAIGGGHELHLMCDLTIASENAIFGQTGPRIGSVPVIGATQMLARNVGEKKAREMLYLCKRYTAKEAEAMGMVNKVVPQDQLESEVEAWCQEILAKSPEALRIAKISLNHESDMSFYASLLHSTEMLSLTYQTEEFKEGMNSFLEKRAPDFKRFRRSEG